MAAPKKMEDIQNVNKTVREMQTTCRFILKRVNDLTQKSQMCSCTQTIGEVEQEIQSVCEKLSGLQEQHSKRDAALMKMQKQINELSSQQDSLKTDLALIVQTDDLKVKRSDDLLAKNAKDYTQETNKLTDNVDSVKNPGSLEVSGPSSNETDDELSRHTIEGSLEGHYTENDAAGFHLQPDDKMSTDTKTKDQDIGNKDKNSKDPTKTKHVAFQSPVKFARSSGQSQRQMSQKDLPKQPSLGHKQYSSTAKENDTPHGNKTSIPAVLNFHNRQHEPSVEVVKQTYKKYVLLFEWQMRRSTEMESGKASGIVDLGGIHTILLVDCSESMQHAWKYVKTFVHDYIAGLEGLRSQYGIHEDHVALVTFGHETKVQQRLTNDFKLLLQCFDCLKVGGPSPFHGGFHMAVAAAGSSEKQVCTVGTLPVRTRVIVISDGDITEPDLEMGPDVADPGKQEMTQSLLNSDMAAANDYNLDMFFVPVGTANMSNFNLMVSLCHGTLLTHQDGYQVARRSLLALNADPFGFGPALALPETLSDRDRADIKSMEEQARFHLDDAKNNEELKFHERDDDVLPPVGSRVRRGPDWQYDDRQDEFMPGTIVGHVPDARVLWVSWDTEKEINYLYRYEQGGNVDVLLVDEPVRLKPGTQIGVGCRVETGPAWKETARHTSGVVLKLFVDELNIPRARVRWENKEQGVYTYMVDGNSLPEIIVSTEENTSTGRVGTPQVSSAQKASRKNKNKNKNA